MSYLPRLAASVLLLTALVAGPLHAQALTGFTRSEDYLVEIDGEAASDAQVYWSQSARMFLIVPRDAPAPLLVEPVTRQVRSVPLVKIAARPDGSVGILDGAQMTPKGALTTDGGLASFTADGRAYKLVEKPPLLGWQTSESIAAYNDGYQRRAQAYQPQSAPLAGLRQEGSEVQVTVFFGSWCPHCQQKVPLAMRLGSELAGSKVKFNFYGLARSFAADPQAKRYNVKSVPTGIVFVDGKEVGRIQGDGWAVPEATIARLVGG